MSTDAPVIRAADVPRAPPAVLAAMLEPARTALLVVDVQRDFAAPDGAMGRIGLDLSGVAPALAKMQALIDAARQAGTTVAFARVLSSPATDSRALTLLMRRKGRPEQALAVCREGTPGADYHAVRPQPGDLEIGKRLFSCFAGTDFDAQLRSRGIDTLVLCGLTTDCCVDCTARDAFHHDYSVLVVADACDAYGAALHAGALLALQKNVALVADTQPVCEALAAAAVGAGRPQR